MRKIARTYIYQKIMVDGKMKRREFFLATASTGEIFYGYFINDIPENLFPLEAQLGYFNLEGITYISPEPNPKFKYTGNSKVSKVTETDFDHLKSHNQKDFKYEKLPEAYIF